MSNDLEIQRTLVLSTRHITHRDAEQLNLLAKDNINALIVYGHGEYGWNIYIGRGDAAMREISETFKEVIQDDPLDPGDLSRSFGRCMSLAISSECCWLRLDRDGPLVEGYGLDNHER